MKCEQLYLYRWWFSRYVYYSNALAYIADAIFKANCSKRGHNNVAGA